MARPGAEMAFERTLFAARWLAAPVYLGLVAALGLLVVVFLRELARYLPQALTLTSEAAIVAVLTLIDLALAANLVVIAMFAGYESVVSRLDAGDGAERLAWMGRVDFAGLKVKLIASIAAISAVDLLKRFMATGPGGGPADASLLWPAAIHLVFVLSGVLLALMDWLSARSGPKAGAG